MADDPYAVLGVARDATPDAIKRAYRKLARQHHPDLNPGKPEAEARFKAAAAANELLSDPDKRARFDRGEINAEGQEQPPAGGYRRHADAAPGERYGGQATDPGMFDDLLAEMFQNRARREAAPRPGEVEHYRLDVAFSAAVLGATETLTLPDGRTLSVRIPPGVTSGQVLRLRGQGGEGWRGGTAGDALIELTVAAHPLYRRDGFDLHMDLPVTLREAVLGGPVEVPTPGGPLRVTLPAGSDTGRVIRLRGKGVAAHGKRSAGDLLLTLRLFVGPPDAALETFLRDWQPANPVDLRANLEAKA
jgi:DnaJ-class molecular chaperone